jgi:hypothetical protein
VHRKGFRGTRITLVTTLLDAARYPVEALAQLSYARWGIEINFAHTIPCWMWGFSHTHFSTISDNFQDSQIALCYA